MLLDVIENARHSLCYSEDLGSDVKTTIARDRLTEYLDRQSQLDRIIRCVNKILFRAEIPFRCLDRRVAQQ